MAEQTLTSPDGVKYRLIGTRTTTPATDAEAKEIRVETDSIEVVVSDSRLISPTCKIRFGSSTPPGGRSGGIVLFELRQLYEARARFLARRCGGNAATREQKIRAQAPGER